MNNLGCLVTVRLKSTRLKKKALLQINGKPLLLYLTKQMEKIFPNEKIVIMTSYDKGDDPLQRFAEENGYPFFRGHPDDVLQRMHDACNEFSFTNFVSVTGDNPFVEAKYAELQLKEHLIKSADFSYTKLLPFGSFSYTLRAEAVRQALQLKNSIDTEVWGGYFHERPDVFSIHEFKDISRRHRRPEIRLTIDVEEDLQLARAILSHPYIMSKNFDANIDDVLKIIDKNPSLLNINDHIHQKSEKPVTFKKHIQ